MPYTPQTWTNGVSKLNATRMAVIETGIAAATATADAAIAGTIVDAKGDLIVATAADTPARLAVGANGKVLEAASGESSGVLWDYPPGYEFGTATMTGPLSVTGTTPGAANVVMTLGAITFDGSTEVDVEFSCPYLAKGSSFIRVSLFVDGSELGRLVHSDVVTNTPAYGRYRYTPAVGSRTFSVRAYVDAGTGGVGAGAGAGDAYVPARTTVRKV